MDDRVDYRDIAALHPHPLNGALYGPESPTSLAELVQSIATHGVHTPLLITANGTIISGHRRYAAARAARVHTVPVIFFASDDPLEIETALIETNRQRAKTNEQSSRENARLLEIEHERGRRRQDAARKREAETPAELVVVISPPPTDRGKARDIVGAQVGMSGFKVERSVAVVKTIDALRAEGRTREAEQLRTTLNTKSVQRAYEEAKEAGHIALSHPASSDMVTERAEAITLAEWETLHPDAQLTILSEPELFGRSGAKFNKQETDHIEWARWSWNPVTGCKHDCSYCYARDIAARYYPQGFVPAFLPSRLSAAQNTPVPPEAATNVACKNVFTCSMADLFGKWVPREWIEAVLEVVRENPQWNFLFLTKFPIRLAEFEFPDNAWLGTTVDAQARIPNAEKAMARVQGGVKWLSCEPMLERLTFSRLDLFDWMVIGGASKSTQTPEFRPPREWVTHLERQAQDAGCKVYEKTNLLERRREYPGAPELAQVVVPDAFKMGYLQRDVLPPEVTHGHRS